MCWLEGEEDRKFGMKVRMDRLVPIAGAGEVHAHACDRVHGVSHVLRWLCAGQGKEKRREEEDSR